MRMRWTMDDGVERKGPVTWLTNKEGGRKKSLRQVTCSPQHVILHYFVFIFRDKGFRKFINRMYQ